GDPRAASKPLDSTDEVEVLDLTDERDRVAAELAPEALPEPLLLVDVERAGLLRMERAQTDPAATNPLQLNVLRSDLSKVDAVADTLDVLVDDRHREDGSGRAAESVERCFRDERPRADCSSGLELAR